MPRGDPVPIRLPVGTKKIPESMGAVRALPLLLTSFIAGTHRLSWEGGRQDRRFFWSDLKEPQVYRPVLCSRGHHIK